MTTETRSRQPEVLSPYVLALGDELAGGTMRSLQRMKLGDLDVEVAQGHDALWIVTRRAGKGGVALRAVHLPTEAFSARKVADDYGARDRRCAVQSVLRPFRPVDRTHRQQGAVNPTRRRGDLCRAGQPCPAEAGQAWQGASLRPAAMQLGRMPRRTAPISTYRPTGHVIVTWE